MSLEHVTQSVRTRLPELKNLGACVQFDMGEDGVLVVDARSQPPALLHEPVDADCTIRLSVDSLEQLIAGTLSPTFAYAMGKLRIEGSMGVAMKLAAMLEG